MNGVTQPAAPPRVFVTFGRYTVCVGVLWFPAGHTSAAGDVVVDVSTRASRYWFCIAAAGAVAASMRTPARMPETTPRNVCVGRVRPLIGRGTDPER